MAKLTTSTKEVEVNELEVLFPERQVEILGRSITVREYSFIEALKLLTIAEPIITRVKQKYIDVPSFQNAAEILLEFNPECSFLINKSCELTLDEVNNLTSEEGVILLAVWWEVNKHGLFEFFKETKNKPSTKKSDNPWTSNITYLLKNGFSLNDIKKLTIRQLKLYTQSQAVSERHKMADDITVVSVGTNGGKETAKIVKDLRK